MLHTSVMTVFYSLLITHGGVNFRRKMYLSSAKICNMLQTDKQRQYFSVDDVCTCDIITRNGRGKVVFCLFPTC